MNLGEAIKILDEHNKWRRGIVKETSHSPKEIGESIDLILKKIKNIENNSILEGQLQIVQHYMDNHDEYSLSNGERWENLKSVKLSTKTDEYINKVSDLIGEWIDRGRDDFCKKYGLSFKCNEMTKKELCKVCAEYDHNTKKIRILESDIEGDKKYPHLKWAVEISVEAFDGLSARQAEIQKFIIDNYTITF